MFDTFYQWQWSNMETIRLDRDWIRLQWAVVFGMDL